MEICAQKNPLGADYNLDPPVVKKTATTSQPNNETPKPHNDPPTAGRPTNAVPLDPKELNLREKYSTEISAQETTPGADGNPKLPNDAKKTVTLQPKNPKIPSMMPTSPDDPP